ncbi:putative transporter [Colletotrichum fructicola]|nr:putative transporter [Colletotrichum fructicola]
MVLSTIDEIAIEPDKKVDYSDRTTIDIKSESVGYEEAPSILEWSEAEEKAIRRKIDWHTVPLTTVLYLLCFLDRSNIGNARIQGMAKDINLEGFRFNWVLSIFYIVYLFVEVPSNIVLKRVGPRFYLPFLVVGFGVVSLCTAFVKTYEGLAAARAFLGVFEGGAMPGFSFFLSSFYRREELLLRIGILISSASLSGAFGGLLATGLSRVPEWGFDSMPIHTWRNIFFFEGFVTILIGLFAPLWMPTNPATAYFLTDRERAIAVERLQREHKSDANEPVSLDHVKRAVSCIHNYTCAFGFFLINITVQGISVFMPTILNDLGWTATKAQLMSVPPYVVACASAVTVAYISDKTRQRGIYLALFSLIAVIGFAILRFETDANIRHMAVFFVTAGAFPGGPGFLSWAMNNSAGPSVRAVTSAYVVTIGTIGGIVATWTYTFKDAPKYFVGHTINLVGQSLAVLLAVFGILYCLYENRMRAAALADGFHYIWIDTCCIDKTSSSELTEAINSMWAWYRHAQICYAYLSDVRSDSAHLGQGYKEFIQSRWFTRGWTLQELIAPSNVIFCNTKWVEIGNRESMRDIVGKITGIDRHFFNHGVLGRYSIAQKMSWAANRVTTRIEDQAYCLLGLFGVNMPLMYGEGEMAFVRLQEEIMRRTSDQSIFAWFDRAAGRQTGFLATSPSCFANSGSVTTYQPDEPQPPYSITNQGISISLQLLASGSSGFPLPFLPSEEGEILSAAGVRFSFSPAGTIAVLNCKNAQGSRLGIYMEKEDGKGIFYRSDHQIGFVSIPDTVVARSTFESVLVGSSNPDYADSLWNKSQPSHHVTLNWHKPHADDEKLVKTPYSVVKAFPADAWVEHDCGHSVVLPTEFGRRAYLLFDNRNQTSKKHFCVVFMVDYRDTVRTYIDNDPTDDLHPTPPDSFLFNDESMLSKELAWESEVYENIEDKATVDGLCSNEL